MIGRHVIKTWSTSQHCLALSSGEAELYALVKASAQTRGLMAIAADFGAVLEGRICTDANAAIGMEFRKGLGKVRHIDVQYLWIQDEVASERLGLTKVDTKANFADIFTKPLSNDVLMKHLTGMGFELRSDRAASAPRLCMLSVQSNHICGSSEGEVREDASYWEETANHNKHQHGRRPRTYFGSRII